MKDKNNIFMSHGKLAHCTFLGKGAENTINNEI